MVPKGHPARAIKKLADEALGELEGLFEQMYSNAGRPSIPPEVLLKSMLLMALFSVRSERQLCEQLEYNMLFRWFVDMDLEDEPFDHSSFGKNRDRLLEHDAVAEFFRAVVKQARKRRLMSAEHFSVDGTLIEAYASMKSFRPKDEDDDDRDGNGWADFKGEKRSNETHESKTDPDAKLFRKGRGREAKLCYVMNALMENRNGLLVGLAVEEANGTAERAGALELVDRELEGDRRITLGGDKGFDTKDMVKECRRRNITPHVAQNITATRGSAIDGRTTGPPGYAISSVVRRRIESIFGWMKTTGNMAKTRYRGRKRVDLWATMAGTAYNLLRIAKLSSAAA